MGFLQVRTNRIIHLPRIGVFMQYFFLRVCFCHLLLVSTGNWVLTCKKR